MCWADVLLNDGRLVDATRAYPHEAADYGAVMIRFQQLPPDQRFEIQQERAAMFAKSSIEHKLQGRPASAAQLGYLKKLGCKQVPKDGLDASKLIEQFKAAK